MRRRTAHTGSWRRNTACRYRASGRMRRRNAGRGSDQSIDDRRYLRQVAKALMTAARQVAAQVEDGEVSIKELKEMAGVLQTLTGLEKTLREEEPAAAETVQVVLGDAEEWSR